ncbi:MAG: DUF115 domain-containing protein [Chloroflexi bacterium]|nr:DUF115 domain-containing protein [Chloroflexota bacterium]
MSWRQSKLVRAVKRPLRRAIKALELGPFFQAPRSPHQAVNALGIPLNANEQRLRRLKDRHRGQRGFVIGTGPSLRVADLDRLHGEVTLSCNRIYLAFDKTDWRPTYYSVYDSLVAEQDAQTIRELSLPKIHGSRVQPLLDQQEALFVTDLTNPFDSEGEPRFPFSRNLLRGAYGGWTVTYLLLQIAFYLGLQEVYLVGIDFSYSVPKATGSQTERGEVVVASQGESNHFAANYRSSGETWTIPRLDYQRSAYQAARAAFEKAGRVLGNASRETKLDVIPRVDFDALFK